MEDGIDSMVLDFSGLEYIASTGARGSYRVQEDERSADSEGRFSEDPEYI
ncbi:MAG: hypothetical protein IKH57_14265 [Clostridia bacterium]|nr:hypothetical protein [Clostridia bacterium]